MNRSADVSADVWKLPIAEMVWLSGGLAGDAVRRSRKTFGEMRGLFRDSAGTDLDEGAEMYSVEWVAPAEGEGALLFGCTRLQAGKVGDEYFMTHGHFHVDRTQAEFYLPVSGEGVLLRMSEGGETSAEEMKPGGVLYIEGKYAHRVVNTGSEPLVFWACWPAKAGHDYGSIARDGFGLAVVERDGKPVLIANEKRRER